MNTKTQPAVVGSSAELGPLPEPVAMIGNDGHPRHIRHVWGVGETRLYGPPRGLYRADQMRDYARTAVAAERERFVDALADACIAAEIPDSKFESLLIALKA